MAKVSESPPIEKEATLMYNGMSMALTASRPLENVTLYEIRPGVCGYTFYLRLDAEGLVIFNCVVVVLNLDFIGI